MMADTPDWKKKAKAEYENEEERIRTDVKAGFYLHLFIFVFLGVVFGAIYVIRWMIVRDNFLPSSHDAAWMIAIAIGAVPFIYFTDRHDRIREVREQRLIRLEMKIDAMLAEQDALLARYEELLRDVRRTMSDTELHIRGIL
ncbi:MAG: hypothetical protein JSS95_01345 [Acidobacteria bacterium]|nr:hypothetical protein [Acidobacteriota bacterium]